MHKAENGRNEEGEQRAFKELAKNAVLSVMYDVQVPSNVETNKVLGSINISYKQLSEACKGINF